MKKVLVTAFEPFGGQSFNSSLMVLEKLPDKAGGIIVKKMLLPVLYEKAFDLLKREIIRWTPDFVICMGQAGGRDKICIERIAVNINNSAVADNNNILIKDKYIKKEGEPAYFTNLPVAAMISSIKDGNVVFSYSAGTYICNDIFYRMMKYISNSDKNVKGGFLHLPFTEYFGKIPYINLDIQVKDVMLLLKVLGGENE